MSSKNLVKIKESIFFKNINMFVDEKGGVSAVSQKIGVSYNTVYQWYKGENLPDGKSLLALHREFNVSIDWLLTGKDSVAAPADQFMCGWPPKTQKACRTVRKILESSDRTTATALLMNIEAFEKSIEKDAEKDRLQADIERMKNDIEELKRISDLKRHTGTD